MKRHYCTSCNTRQYADRMKQVNYTLLKKSAWHCIECLSATGDNLHRFEGSKDRYLVEFFSGSKTVAKIAQADFNYRTFTVDISAALQPDLSADILDLRRQDIPDAGRVSLLWASIPCTTYSVMSLGHHWKKIVTGYRKYFYYPVSDDAKEAVRILGKTLQLIREINPDYFVIENPRGALRHMPQMKTIPYRHTVSYEDFGLEVYKPTDLFTNIPGLQFPQLRGAMGRKFAANIVDMQTAYERSIVPPALIQSILSQLHNGR